MLVWRCSAGCEDPNKKGLIVEYFFFFCQVVFELDTFHTRDSIENSYEKTFSIVFFLLSRDFSENSKNNFLRKVI